MKPKEKSSLFLDGFFYKILFNPLHNLLRCPKAKVDQIKYNYVNPKSRLILF